MAGAYKTGKYRNIFKEYGYPEEEIQKRVEDTLSWAEAKTAATEYL